MAGKRMYDAMGEIKKGPWKVEEDEVLINHVKKYGPRDWSSIRSKGLLQRTGKSCRLRWVNKLRPNLKKFAPLHCFCRHSYPLLRASVGVKFSAEEERVVIELQGQFGNKWARIATYLPGRTDNDVKNFWSSRQKRLARILHTPTPPSSKSQKKSGKQVAALHQVPTLEAPKLSSSTEEESSSKAQSCSSSYIDYPETIKMLPLPELVLNSYLLSFEPNILQLESSPVENKPCPEPQLDFPQIAPLQADDLPLTLESQGVITRFGDANFLNVLASHAYASEIVQLPYASSCFDPERGCQNGGQGEDENPVTPDSFIDDFPMDMFDHIEPLPSPSEW
ncbi:hypothetical protein RJ639_004154 [Escallonia herrerae]|uniref:Uncharacterized protein n=1 Tax=Escallonia herrerae TaxID=1293975 RepID=A0AA89AWJ7_9ASTE|nr:hypothetical protein RJ639_004154 [Escallonia herrerae]